MDDVAEAVWSGKAQFFPLEKSAIITEIVDYPQKAMCRIWLAGGDLDELMDAEISIAHGTAKTIPIKTIQVKTKLPPYDKKGSGSPVTGIIPRVIAIFTKV